MTIASGTVSIEDGLKAKEEYAPARKVRVDLNFIVPEGGDDAAMLNSVAVMADNKVRELLGKPTYALEAPKGTPPAAPEVPKKAAGKKAAETPKAPEKTKADLAREAGLPVEDIASKGIDESEAPGSKSEDDLGDVLGDAAPAPITDAELGKAAQEKNAKMKAEQGEKWAPSKIRDLIAKFNDNVAGKRINDIAADKRPQFIAELKALV